MSNNNTTTNTTTTKSFLSQGRDTYKVPLSMFADNRKKLIDQLLLHHHHDVPNGSVIYIKGGPSPTRYDTDHEPIFRQESYMWWLTGVKEPDVSVVIEVSSSSTSSSTSSSYPKTTLFIPRLPPDYATVMGRIRLPNEWKSLYEVDEVLYIEELESMLETTLVTTAEVKTTETTKEQQQQEEDLKKEIKENPKKKLLLLKGRNSDSGFMYEPPTFDKTTTTTTSTLSLGLLQERSNVDILFPILAECRVIKSPMELELLKVVAQVSSYAHAYVMRNTKSGMMEYQCESLFRHYSYYNYGCRLVSYTSICACGPSAATLHYGHSGYPNGRQLLEHESCLFDMGAEYQGYASDITCSFPVNGKFSTTYQPIYEGVLQAQIAVYNMLQPGVSWIDCHKAAELEILKALYQLDIIKLPSSSNNNNKDDDDGTKQLVTTTILEDLVELRLGAIFMPHGLGHFIGIDTHDVGGYLPGHPERSTAPGLKSLRTSRVMQENMVVTVEPGCYFIDHLLDEIIHSSTNEQPHPFLQYLNPSKLEPYRGTGGVRLEDVVAITKDGCVNYTCCPRTVSEVEHVMARGMWPPTKDEAPELRRMYLTKPIPLGSPLPAPPSH